MKTKNILIGVMASVVALSSCKKDIPVAEKVITAPEFVNPTGSSTYVLIPENENGAFETFAWKEAYLGEGVEATYELQIDDAEGDFSEPQKLEATKELYKNVTTGEMNQILRDLKIEPSSALGIQARIVAMGGEIEMISIPVSMLVKRYSAADENTRWGIFGSSVTGGDFTPLSLDTSDNLWKGIILLEAGEFKFQSPEYISKVLGSDGTTDGLKEDGDAIATENAVYKIILDLENMKFTLEKSSFPNNLYLVGSHNGWDNTTASENKNFLNGTYEVYQYNDAAFECKWLPQLGAWDNDLGDDPANPGSIIVDGENNVAIPEGGFWYIKADLATATWESKKTEWGIIGDSTPGSWDSQTNFTDFDAATNTFTMEAELTAKELKFRGTSDWSLNYGGNGLNGEPIAGGDNIKIPEDGTYSITLTLGHGGNYSYSIVKK
ncbi:MAG: SusE domain-containing protein [Chlamydiia bacterium]|nr:SusE domain-containing protein [Chlamydiia bacterium]